LSFLVFIICKIIMFKNNKLIFFLPAQNENLILHGIIEMKWSPRVWKFTFMFVLILEHIVSNWRPTWVVKHGAKNSQMLMGTENTWYKGKSLHVHRNIKNHISENKNGKYTHCFLIHLNNFIFFKYKKHTNPRPNS
jgi:hypothetical protein